MTFRTVAQVSAQGRGPGFMVSYLTWETVMIDLPEHSTIQSLEKQVVQ